MMRKIGKFLWKNFNFFIFVQYVHLFKNLVFPRTLLNFAHPRNLFLVNQTSYNLYKVRMTYDATLIRYKSTA